MASGKGEARSRRKSGAGKASSSTVQPVAKPTDRRTLERRSEWIGLVIVGAASLFGAALWSFTPADMDLIHAGQGSNEHVSNLVSKEILQNFTGKI